MQHETKPESAGAKRTLAGSADELGLSPNTIKGYIHNVYQKSSAVDKQDLLDRVELHAEGRPLSS